MGGILFVFGEIIFEAYRRCDFVGDDEGLLTGWQPALLAKGGDFHGGYLEGFEFFDGGPFGAGAGVGDSQAEQFGTQVEPADAIVGLDIKGAS